MSQKMKYRVNAKGQVEQVSAPASWLLVLMTLLFSSLIGAAVYLWQQQQPKHALPPENAAQMHIPELDWEQLMLLDYETGKVPAELQQWLGQRVKISGFIVPLDAQDMALTEFLLVPVYGMCIHVPPPPPNMMIHVKPEKGLEAGYWIADGVWLEGELKVQKVDSDYGAAGFVMQSPQIYPVTFENGSTSLETSQDRFSTQENLAYGTHPRQVLDIWYYPDAFETTSLILFIHGGGFNSGDKSHLDPALRRLFLDAGIAVASLNYRYTQEAPYPAPMHDAARAIQFLREQAAAFNLNKTRFGALGVEMGGGIALWLGLHDDLRDADSSDAVLQESSRLQAVAGLSAPTSYDVRLHQRLLNTTAVYPPLLDLFGISDVKKIHQPEYFALYEEASPVTHVSIDDPDVFLYYPRQQALKQNPRSDIYISHVRFGEYLKQKMQAIGRSYAVHIMGRDDEQKNQDLNEALLMFFLQNFDNPSSTPLL